MCPFFTGVLEDQCVISREIGFARQVQTGQELVSQHDPTFVIRFGMDRICKRQHFCEIIQLVFPFEVAKISTQSNFSITSVQNIQ